MRQQSNSNNPIRELNVLTFVESSDTAVSESIEMGIAQDFIPIKGAQLIHCIDIDSAINSASRVQRAILYFHADYENSSGQWKPLEGGARFNELVQALDDRSVPWILIAMNPPRDNSIIRDCSLVVTNRMPSERQLNLFYSQNFSHGDKIPPNL